MAVVFPDERALRELSKKVGNTLPDMSLESLTQDAKLEREVFSEMLVIAKLHGLRGVELIKGVVLVAEEWTPENVNTLATLWPVSLTHGAVDAHGRKKIESQKYCVPIRGTNKGAPAFVRMV
jgi:long-subunit acyl-CoA synthetase (AMP-forming)